MFTPRLRTLPLLLVAAAIHAENDGAYAEEDCIPCYEQCYQPCAFGAGGDWLYMRPLSYPNQVARHIAISSYSNLEGIEIDSQELCFKTDHSSGFDLYAFYRSPPSCEGFSWEVRGAFAAHKFNETQFFSADEPASLQPSVGFIPQIVVNFFSQAQATLNTDFESVRGLLGGTYSLENNPVFRLFSGVEYANIKQSFRVLYEPSSFPVGELDTGSFTNVQQFSRFSGIGPVFGASGQLPLMCGFSIFGGVATSILFAKHGGSFEQETLIGSSSAPAPQSDLRIKDRFCPSHSVTPAVDGQVGLKLEVDFWGCFSLGLSAAYRGIYYWNAISQLAITSSRLFAQGETADYRDSSSAIRNQSYGLTGWVIGGSLQF